MGSSTMKFFPKIAIVFFIISGILLLVTPTAWWPRFYDLPYMGWAALVCAMAIALAPERFKAMLAAILFLNASGDLGLYELYHYHIEYDKVIHFVSPLIATLTLRKYYSWKQTVLIIVAFALGWELFEFLADALIKTHLFGVFRQHVWSDTAGDLAMNCLGVILGLWIFSRTGSGERSTAKL